jgi:hypothetical protein
LGSEGFVNYKRDSVSYKLDTFRLPDVSPPMATKTTLIKLKFRGNRYKIKNVKYFWPNDGVSYRTYIDTVKHQPLTIDSSLIEGKFSLVRILPQRVNEVKSTSATTIRDTSDQAKMPTRSATAIAQTVGQIPLPVINPRKYSYIYEFNLYGECKIHEHHPGSCTQGVTKTTYGVYEIKGNRVILYECFAPWNSASMEPTVFSFSSKDTLLFLRDSLKYARYDEGAIPKFEFKTPH